MHSENKMQINANDLFLEENEGLNSRSHLCLDFTVVYTTFAGKLSKKKTRVLFVPFERAASRVNKAPVLTKTFLH